MSRRSVSPIRFRGEGDPRDNIIRKLKEDIIVAKGKQKEQALLESYLLQVIERSKLIMAQTAKADEEGRIQIEVTLKSLNDHKKQAETLRVELKKVGNQLRETEDEASGLKRLFTSREIEIDNLMKEAGVFEGESQKLLSELVRLKSQEEEAVGQIAGAKEKSKIYEMRIIEVNKKLDQVRSFINEMSDQGNQFREKLRNYEKENSLIGDQIDQKDTQIDIFEHDFAQQHDIIKKLVENYIDLENQQERVLKETQHNLTLLRAQTQKGTELTAKVKKVQKNIGDRRRELQQVRNDSKDIIIANQQLKNQNNKTRTDILDASEHLDNILKNNSFLREEMEEMLREDEAIIAILRRKRLISIKP